jgi:hypothetical protein
MSPSFLLVTSFYPQFVNRLYEREPGLAEQAYAAQLDRLLTSGFSAVDAYRNGLARLGCDVDVVIVDADRLQRQWAREHGLDLQDSDDRRRRQRRIVEAQIAAARPDVLYVFEWSPLGDDFLRGVRRHVGSIVGQIASPLRPDRTYRSYNLMISALPTLVEHFRENGMHSERLKLGFDPRVLTRLSRGAPQHEVTFVGGFAEVHDDRIPWLERLAEEVDIDVFGYGMDRVPATSPIHERYRGEAWGYDMFSVLAHSRITLNMHARIDVGSSRDGKVAANMRLYEATGVGTCLVTDHKDNLAELFEPGREVATYKNPDACAATVKRLLADEPARRSIAAAGQMRTLAEHGYDARMVELLELLGPLARHGPTRRSAVAAGR